MIQYSGQRDSAELFSLVDKAVKEVIAEFPKSMQVWQEANKLTDVNLAKQLGQSFKSFGFGYVIALLDQLHKSGNAIGKNILNNINFKTIVKSSLLNQICTLINLFLYKNQVDEKVKIKLLEARKEFAEAAHQVKGIIGINHEFPAIPITAGANEMQKMFEKQMLQPFMDVEYIDAKNTTFPYPAGVQLV